MKYPAADILTKARNVISQEENWTKKYFARDSLGNPIPVEEAEAKCFCAVGAMYKVCAVRIKTDESFIDNFQQLLTAEIPENKDRRYADHQNIINYNDDSNTSHKQILEVFDRAIATAKERGTEIEVEIKN